MNFGKNDYNSNEDVKNYLMYLLYFQTKELYELYNSPIEKSQIEKKQNYYLLNKEWLDNFKFLNNYEKIFDNPSSINYSQNYLDFKNQLLKTLNINEKEINNNIEDISENNNYLCLKNNLDISNTNILYPINGELIKEDYFSNNITCSKDNNPLYQILIGYNTIIIIDNNLENILYICSLMKDNDENNFNFCVQIDGIVSYNKEEGIFERELNKIVKFKGINNYYEKRKINKNKKGKQKIIDLEDEEVGVFYNLTGKYYYEGEVSKNLLYENFFRKNENYIKNESMIIIKEEQISSQNFYSSEKSSENELSKYQNSQSQQINQNAILSVNSSQNNAQSSNDIDNNSSNSLTNSNFSSLGNKASKELPNNFSPECNINQNQEMNKDIKFNSIVKNPINKFLQNNNKNMANENIIGSNINLNEMNTFSIINSGNKIKKYNKNKQINFNNNMVNINNNFMNYDINNRNLNIYNMNNNMNNPNNNMNFSNNSMINPNNNMYFTNNNMNNPNYNMNFVNNNINNANNNMNNPNNNNFLNNNMNNLNNINIQNRNNYMNNYMNNNNINMDNSNNNVNTLNSSNNNMNNPNNNMNNSNNFVDNSNNNMNNSNNFMNNSNNSNNFMNNLNNFIDNSNNFMNNSNNLMNNSNNFMNNSNNFMNFPNINMNNLNNNMNSKTEDINNDKNKIIKTRLNQSIVINNDEYNCNALRGWAQANFEKEMDFNNNNIYIKTGINTNKNFINDNNGNYNQ